MDLEYFMKVALKEAKKSLETEDVPVGAIVVKDGQIISKGHNEVEKRKDPTAHAETIAIRKAIKKLGNKHLLDCVIFSTLEPCPMCAGAMVLARVNKLVFAAYDPKSGAAGSVVNIVQNTDLNHRIDFVGGILEQESAKLLRDFFQRLRAKNV